MKKLLPLLLLACPAWAETPLSADAFDQYTRGKTFYYADSDRPYGGEEYLENRRVRWSFLDGKCKDGVWYEENGLICFVYDDPQTGASAPQCWSFFITPKGLSARFENTPGATELYEVEQSPEPMLCLGPEIGV